MGTSPLLMNPKRSSNRRTSCECKRVSAARARRDVRACHGCSTAVGVVRPNYATGNRRPLYRLQYSQHRQYSQSQHVHHLERCDIRRQLEKLQDLHSIRCSSTAMHTGMRSRQRTNPRSASNMEHDSALYNCRVQRERTTYNMQNAYESMQACSMPPSHCDPALRHTDTPVTCDRARPRLTQSYTLECRTVTRRYSAVSAAVSHRFALRPNEGRYWVRSH